MNKAELKKYLSENKNLIWPIGCDGYGLKLYTFHFTSMCESLGFELVKETPYLTSVRPHVFESVEEVTHFHKEHGIDRGSWANELESIKSDRASSNDIIAGGCFGLFTLAMNILGINEGLRMVRKKPEIIKKLIDILTDYIIELANKEGKVGADLFWIAEPSASLISPKMFEELCLEAYRKIVSSIHMETMLHVCGSTNKHTGVFEKTGISVLSIDYCTDISNVLRNVSKDTIIMGNFSPMVLRDATRDELALATRDYLEQIKGYDNVIMSTGCAIAQNTPIENILTWVDICRER